MKKILIIAGGLQRGGAEKVAANIFQYAPKGTFSFHYLVFSGIENVYGDEIERNGGKVFTIQSPSLGYFTYFRTLLKLMRQYRYDVVHSHTMFNSGINLLAALLCGVRIRIAHSHTTKTETKVSGAKKLYEHLMRALIYLCASNLFACGQDAGIWLFGKWAFQKKGIVIRNGFDVKACLFNEQNRQKVRDAYGLRNQLVIGHSGTLLPVKNQMFLIELMPDILSSRPDAMLMLLGGGEEVYTKLLKEKVKTYGVEDKVIFCGAVDNVAEYLSAMDVFAFPSLREGTPLALLEAQANGLPCIISDRIPMDAQLTSLVKAYSLDSKAMWIEALCAASREKSEVYNDQVIANGYDAKDAYLPIYESYRGKRNG